MRKIRVEYVSTLLICLICVVSISCSFFVKIKWAEYDNYYNAGGRYVIERKFDKAEESFNKALTIAEEQHWSGQIVATKQRLAEVYLATNRYDETKEELREALDICLNHEDCSPGLLGSVYDYLIFLSITKEGDSSAARKYIDQVISLRERLEKDKDEDFKKRLLGYAENLKSAGFDKESKDIADTASSMPDSP